jgi:hypothetical protein
MFLTQNGHDHPVILSLSLIQVAGYKLRKYGLIYGKETMVQKMSWWRFTPRIIPE